MNVEIGAEAALFPEKEYIKGIFVAVWNDSWKLRKILFSRQTSMRKPRTYRRFTL
jgi:hypothetical protein